MCAVRTPWRVLVVLALVASAAAADTAPWLSNEWTTRRVVDAEVQAADQPGEDVAVCTFYTGGLAKADASDVRVAVRGRKLVKHRVLQAGPGDLIRVAFEAVPAEKRYYVYYGNPKAEPPEPWEIRRGVLLEARKASAANAKDLAGVKAAWDKGTPLGTDFVSHVSFGFNPFADDATPAIFHYVGWFVVPEPGEYSIATSSYDGSWILIDGEPLVSWPGVHGPVHDARHAKSKLLSRDVHRIDYWNASGGGHTMSVAAWRGPGAKGERYDPIPAAVFLPVTEAKLIEVDQRAERLVADFFPEHVGEAWWPRQYAVRVQFQNLSKGVSLRYGGRFEWDFGDGQTSAEASPTHVYLAHGDYVVSVKASRAAASYTFSTKVWIERDWWQQSARKTDSIGDYAADVAKYDFQKLDTDNLILAVDLFEHQNMKPSLVTTASELVLRRQDVRQAVRLKAGLTLGRTLRDLERPDEAVTAYQQLEQRLKARAQKAQAAIQLAETVLRDLGRYGEAEKQYQRVLKDYATAGVDQVLRRAHIGLGDIWRHRSDGKKAREAYRSAAAIRVAFRPPNEEAVRVGTLARYVEEYTRERQWEWAFQFLDEWAWEFPTHKLEGHWSLLRAKALLGRGDRDEALVEAMDLVGANPASPYAVRFLMLAAEGNVAKGLSDKARLLLQTAVEDYPEDPQHEAARQRLQALGGPVKAD